METTERIVEAYVRYVKGWATIPNVRCAGQNEIDLIAIDPVTLNRYHIETSVSISQGFRRLTAKPFDPTLAKVRVHQASQRRTLGFFIEKKFGAPGVVGRLKDYGFVPGEYGRVIVTWGWDTAAADAADSAGVTLWDFREMIREIATAITGSRQYFADNTLRTLNLFVHANAEAQRMAARTAGAVSARETGMMERPAASSVDRYWVYENWLHNYASIHRGSCSYCNDGRGMHAGSSKDNGEWHGPFATADEAWARAERTGREEVKRCGHCSPVVAALPGR